MYAQKIFRMDDVAAMQACLTSIGAVSLVTTATAEHGGGLMSTLVPVIVDARSGAAETTLIGHIARANPQWQHTDTRVEALAIAVGANGYVSPTWYESKATDPRVVPTWNFTQVQARGPVEFVHDRDELGAIVRSLTDHHEAHRPEPWAVDDAPADFVDAKLSGIVGIKMIVRELEGSAKLSQNQPVENRHGVVAGLTTEQTPSAEALRADMLDQGSR